MAGGKEQMGGEWGKAGNERRKEALDSPTGRTHAPFSLVPAPPGISQGTEFGLGPPAPVSARVGEKGLLGTRLGRFFSAGAAKTPGEDLLGTRLEML